MHVLEYRIFIDTVCSRDTQYVKRGFAINRVLRILAAQIRGYKFKAIMTYSTYPEYASLLNGMVPRPRICGLPGSRALTEDELSREIRF